MKKLLSTTLAVSIFASLNLAPVLAAVTDIPFNQLPDLRNETNAHVTQHDADMNVQIQGGKGGVGLLEWNSFNVGRDATVNFEFTNHNQTALNKVDSTGGLSQIYGSLTNSCGVNCGYAGTGKVILINPNGILFGENANVNLNSFTATTFDGKYENKTLQDGTMEGSLSLNRQPGAGSIYVMKGANIHGDKNVTLAGSNIYTYAGSKISTQTGINDGNAAFGKVKLVTADGVNFRYYSNGAVKNIDESSIKYSTDKMRIMLNGEITSGNIDARNYSVDTQSDINIGGDGETILKATKASLGNDGNIWLTAANDVIIANGAKLESQGGNIEILSGRDISIDNTSLTAEQGEVNLTSEGSNATLNNSALKAAKSTITAGKIASIQQASKVDVKGDLSINGKERAQIFNSTVNADNIDIIGDRVSVKESTLTANKNINANSLKDDLTVENSALKAGKTTLRAAKDANLTNVDLTNSQTNIYAGHDINATVKNVGERKNGLVAEAKNTVNIETDGVLSVSRLVAENGDMNLKATKIIAGLPYTDEQQIPTEEKANRSYIYVLNGKFNANTSEDKYEFTASDSEITENGNKYQTRHHIQFGNGDEKILLINKQPYSDDEPQQNPQPDNNASIISAENDQASMLNKLPRQPEIFNNNTNITNGRTSFVDVYAAASQIEIEDEEE